MAIPTMFRDNVKELKGLSAKALKSVGGSAHHAQVRKFEAALAVLDGKEVALEIELAERASKELNALIDFLSPEKLSDEDRERMDKLVNFLDSSLGLGIFDDAEFVSEVEALLADTPKTTKLGGGKRGEKRTGIVEGAPDQVRLAWKDGTTTTMEANKYSSFNKILAEVRGHATSKGVVMGKRDALAAAARNAVTNVLTNNHSAVPELGLDLWPESAPVVPAAIGAPPA